MATLASQLLANQRRLLENESSSPGDHWVPRLVPGPLQTPAYMTAILNAGIATATPEQIAEAVALRQARAARLLETPTTCQRYALTWPGLRRPVLDEGGMAEQMRHLSALATTHTHIEIRVVPEDTIASWTGPFTVRDGVVTVEGPEGIYTPPGEAELYRSLFSSLWESGRPYPCT